MYTKKTIWQRKLIGLTRDGTIANTHQAKEVVCFVDVGRTCEITFLGRGVIVMETREDRQVLFAKHHKKNYYKAQTLNGKELRIALKKTTGTLKCLEEVPMPDDVVERLLEKGYYRCRDGSY